MTVLSLKRGTGAGLTATPVTDGAGSPLTTRTLTLRGSDVRDEGGEGTIQLVSPGRIDRASDRGGTQGLFAVQTLAFVPEPGTLSLLGLGTAALAAAGRRRLR